MKVSMKLALLTFLALTSPVFPSVDMADGAEAGAQALQPFRMIKKAPTNMISSRKLLQCPAECNSDPDCNVGAGCSAFCWDGFCTVKKN